MDPNILQVLEIVSAKLIANEIRVRKGRIRYSIPYPGKDDDYDKIKIISKVRNKKLHGICKIHYSYYDRFDYEDYSRDIIVTFVDGVKHGPYREEGGEESTIVTCTYENDVLHGAYSKEYGSEDGSDSRHYVNGMKHGSFVHKNTDIVETRTYNNDLLHGLYLKTKGDKTLIRCHYVNGKKYGAYEENYESGKSYIRAEYYNDLLQGEYMKFHNNGKLDEFITRYVDGKKCGAYAVFNKNGDLEFECQYQNDIKHGICKTYYRMYDIIMEEVYDGGVVTSNNKYSIEPNVLESILNFLNLTAPEA
ncbi:Hypothetical protein HVR_LOCUS197 [uncultured virus]|nr:Hypothetical protein HVR_LOCUS197 [uncultured virus]